MPYITRDKENIIHSLHNEEQFEGQEFLANDSPQILNFVKSNVGDENQLFLDKTDTDLIRVLEDLVDLLTEKHIILFTDLPTAAQSKLLQRKSVRKSIHHNIIDTDEEDIF